MAPVTMATEREKLHLIDQLTAEQLKRKKYALYAAEAEDEDLQAVFSRYEKARLVPPGTGRTATSGLIAALSLYTHKGQVLPEFQENLAFFSRTLSWVPA